MNLAFNKRYLIFGNVLENVYYFCAGEYINSRHRVISSLKQLTKAIRFLVVDKLYRIHVTNPVSLLITKLDPKDLPLSSQIANSIFSTICFVLVSNISDDNFFTFESYTLPFIQQHYHYIKERGKGMFTFNKSILIIAFIASFTEIENIIRVYNEKIFFLIDVKLEDGWKDF